VHECAEHADLEVLTLPGAVPGVQRGQDAERGGVTGDRVGQRRAAQPRVLRIQEQPGQAAVAERHAVVGRHRRVGAAAAESADAAVHQLRADARQHVPADTQALHHAGTEVLDQDVRGPHQVEQAGAVLVGLEVEHDAALPPVEGHERRVESAGLPLAERVARRGLDLDDVGAHLGQQHRGAGTGDVGAEVQHAHVRQRQGPTGGRPEAHVSGTIRHSDGIGKTYGPSPHGRDSVVPGYDAGHSRGPAPARCRAGGDHRWDRAPSTAGTT
jgi:hypothetical protein